MKISIITVCFNSEKTIEKTFESLLNQTCSDFEYIVVDGASRDNTLEIIKKYEPLFNGRMKYISEPDEGIYDAMNKGIKMASGQLIGILNSDDSFERDAVENMANAYDKALSEKMKYLVLYGMVRLTRNGNELGIEMYHHSNLEKQMIHHPACFVEKDVYEKFGVFNTAYKSAADYDFMMRLFHEKEVSFVPVYKLITNFEQGGMSSGSVGPVETAQIKYKYGLVPKSRITYEKIHSWLTRVYRRIK